MKTLFCWERENPLRVYTPPSMQKIYSNITKNIAQRFSFLLTRCEWSFVFERPPGSVLANLHVVPSSQSQFV